jgi:hypothetical protein
MARKPRSQWSPAYRKRIERAEAKGQSRQAARGHKGGREHIARKAAKGLTPSQSAKVAKFAREQARKDDNNPDPDEAARRLKEWARDHGFHRFEQLKEIRDRRHGEKRTRDRQSIELTGGGTAILHISIGHVSTADMQADFDDFDLPDMEGGDDFAWFFYH